MVPKLYLVIPLYYTLPHICSRNFPHPRFHKGNRGISKSFPDPGFPLPSPPLPPSIPHLPAPALLTPFLLLSRGTSPPAKDWPATCALVPFPSTSSGTVPAPRGSPTSLLYLLVYFSLFVDPYESPTEKLALQSCFSILPVAQSICSSFQAGCDLQLSQSPHHSYRISIRSDASQIPSDLWLLDSMTCFHMNPQDVTVMTYLSSSTLILWHLFALVFLLFFWAFFPIPLPLILGFLGFHPRSLSLLTPHTLNAWSHNPSFRLPPSWIQIEISSRLSHSFPQ